MVPDTILAEKHFLSGGGEMGALTRSKDWSKTAVGPVEGWPQSLRTTLSIILNSKFPMFLWWGPELTCFYNDAYRPSLGENGKHPSILGMKAEEAWTEIWQIIKPLIDEVMMGKSVWSDDQLIPIYRNGKIEDVYWTFGYSPVNDETGNVAAVLVTCFETTEKVQTFQKLEDRNAELQFAIEAAELGTFDYNPFTRKFSANDRLKEWFGLPLLSEIELQQAINAMAENDRAKVTAAIQKALTFSSGGNFDIEYSIIQPPTKKETIVRAKGKAWFNEEKIAYRFNGTLEDITKQSKAYKKIEINEQKLNVVIEASELGIFELNLKTDVVEYSERFNQIFGYTDEKITHNGFIKHLYPDDVVIRNKAFEKSFETGILRYQSRIIMKDKSIHWIEVMGRIFYDEQKSPAVLVGTCRDITSEKRFQQQLEEREQKFRLLADSMPQLVWTSDLKGNLNYFNQSVYDYSGLSPEQIDKEGWLQIVHPDDREANIKAWVKTIATGDDFIFEHRFRKHDGEYRWQLSRAIPQKDEHGKIKMWVGTSTDIEDQKTFTQELEKQVQERTIELEEKNSELEKMNDELQSFAYVSSHDLQEPLRKIQTFATWLLEKEEANLSDTGKDYFRRLQTASNRMKTLIEDLLAYSRTNTAERIFEKTDLTILLQQVKEDLKEDIELKNAVIESNKLPEAKIIPFQFRQLLLNLIGNSLKFSRPGITPHIKIHGEITAGSTFNNNPAFQHKQYYHLSVSDNGIGFNPIYKDRIFEVFQRLHGKEQYKGTGIGLAIVKKIVANHNGIITANAEVDKGATFDIYIPAS